MSQQWYARTEGVVSGPFSAEQLRLLAQAGQLDELSVDRDKWYPADRVRELVFAVPSERNEDSDRAPADVGSDCGSDPDGFSLMANGAESEIADRRYLADWRWAYEQLQNGALDRFKGQHIAVVDRRIILANTDPAVLQERIRTDGRVDSDRVVLMYVNPD